MQSLKIRALKNAPNDRSMIEETKDNNDREKQDNLEVNKKKWRMMKYIISSNHHPHSMRRATKQLNQTIFSTYGQFV